jgi:hypothetical protein
MSQKPETSIDAASDAVAYQKATGVHGVRLQDSTTQQSDQRTVVTTQTQGTVRLLYAPREQFRLTGKTTP